MSQFVTGEAVVLDLRPARVPSRALAFAIDLAVQLVMLFALMLMMGVVLTGADTALAAAIILTVVLWVFLGYPAVVEHLSRGRSLGKLALGLRVVRDDGGPVSFRHAFTRALAGFVVDFWVFGLFGAVGVIVSVSSSRGKRVGDLLAGTVVVRERVPSQGLDAVFMPPPLAGWAHGTDLSLLPGDLALATRQFLGRARWMSPQARAALAAGLATEVSRFVSPAAPPGTPAEAYLAAVLAERRRRDLERLGGRPPGPHGAPARPATSPPPATRDSAPPPPTGQSPDGGFAPPA